MVDGHDLSLTVHPGRIKQKYHYALRSSEKLLGSNLMLN